MTFVQHESPLASYSFRGGSWVGTGSRFSLVYRLPTIRLARVALHSELRNATREDIFGRSTTGQKLELFGVSSPLHRDFGGGVIDVTQIVGREFD